MPPLFSRLIDALSHRGVVHALIPGFLLYAVLLGLSSALQRVVQHRSWLGESRLHHQHALFRAHPEETTAFFVEHNPAEIQNANQRGSRALSVIVQLSLMELIPGALQIVLTLVTLGALINVEVVAITATYGGSR